MLRGIWPGELSSSLWKRASSGDADGDIRVRVFGQDFCSDLLRLRCWVRLGFRRHDNDELWAFGIVAADENWPSGRHGWPHNRPSGTDSKAHLPYAYGNRSPKLKAIRLCGSQNSQPNTVWRFPFPVLSRMLCCRLLLGKPMMQSGVMRTRSRADLISL